MVPALDNAEALREALFELQRECGMLRTEVAHSRLLLDALDALLTVEIVQDPFAATLGALREVFAFSNLLVLSAVQDSERKDSERQDTDRLECISATEAPLIGASWTAGRFFKKVLRGKAAVTLNNAALPEWQSAPPGAADLGVSALYLPLQVRDSHAIMILLRRAGDPMFDRGDIGFATKFAVLASHALAARHANRSEAERAHLHRLTRQLENSQKALRERANRDPLTKLANRTYFEERVDAALAKAGDGDGDGIALAFIDLDNFKKVNDVHGHAAGDALLKAVADRVRRTVRTSDLVGRISGDEFVVLFESRSSPSSPAEFGDLARRLGEVIREPYDVEGARLSMSASIGLAVSPDHGLDYDTLRRNADTAMYRAKSFEKGTVSLFNVEMGREAHERLALEQRLRMAVDNGEFTCAFQRKVNLRTGAVVGYEALARWVDAQGSVIAPGMFLDVSSELGLLPAITQQVLDSVLAHQPTLEPGTARQARVSVNVSASQASDVAFMQSLALRFAATPSPSAFMIELTEDALVAAQTFQVDILPRLREIGVRVSIDDFGTGFSSLAMLSDITADELKIDRSIITEIDRRPRSQSILRAIASLSQALNIEIVAEGVETEAEHAYLRSMPEIAIGQGYLFGRPFLPDQVSGQDAWTGRTAALIPSPVAA